MAERTIKLRYVGEAAPNFEEAVTFYQDAWGLDKIDGEDGIAFFAAPGNTEQYIFRVRRDPDKRLDVIAFAVDSAADVDAMAGELASSGVRFASEPGQLQTPGGGYGFRVFDPDGRVVEISSDVAGRQAREVDRLESIPEGLSHMVLSSMDVAKTVSFYRNNIGFMPSDTIGANMCFLRCDDEHHRIAVFKGASNTLNHVAFHMRSEDEYMRATGRVMSKGGVMRWGPGRHLVGDNTFSYFFDPNGHISELTSGMEKLNGRPAINIPPEQNGETWGTANWITEDAVPAAYTVPETGHWVAPPV